MQEWGINPVGGLWLVAGVAIGLGLLLLVGSTGRLQSRGRRAALLGLRALTLLLLLLVMLRPTRVLTETRRLPGSLVILVDSSRSMQVADSLDNRPRWDALREVLGASSDRLAKLAEAWDLRLYRFDETATEVPLEAGHAQLPDQPEGSQSAMGAAIDDVLQRESRQRIAAVLLLGDGAQRAFAPRDLPPQTAVRRLVTDNIPLYTFTFGKPALGQQADLRVNDLLVSDVVFADTPVNVQGMVGIDGYANQTFKVQLLWELPDSDTPDGDMEVVDTREVRAGGRGRQIPITLSHTPQQPGEYKVSLRIESPEGELVTTNNEQSTFVTVLKGGIQVLYLAGATRIGGTTGIEPRFVRGALAAHADIHVDYEVLNYRRPRLDYQQRLRRDRQLSGKYDVFLLADVDASALSGASWRRMAELVDQGAGLAMTGGFHSFGPGGFRGTALERVLPIELGRAERQNFGEPPRQDMHLPGPVRMLPVRTGLGIHPIMQVTEDPQSSEAAWRELPPLDGANRLPPRGLKPNSQVIAQSDTSGRARPWPLLVIGAWGGGRTLAFAGDSTWHWQMEGFGQLHHRFWRQVILWLAQKDETKGRHVWLRLDQRRYQRGSRASFSLGATNSQGAPVPNATFQIEVTGPDDFTKSVSPTRRGNALVGNFQETNLPGDYTVTVTAAESDGSQILGTARARFTVPDQDMELDQPAAEPTLMASLANLTATAGGQGLAPEEFHTLLKQLESRKKDFEEEIVKKISLWDSWPVLLTLVALLGTEWWLRKRWGLV